MPMLTTDIKFDISMEWIREYVGQEFYNQLFASGDYKDQFLQREIRFETKRVEPFLRRSCDTTGIA